MIVSILLPTIRPALFRLRMEEYARLKLLGPCEVVVVSDKPELFNGVDQPQPLLTLKHLGQPRQGTVRATNLAFEHAEGHYVMATNDEVEFERDMFMELVSAAEKNGEGIFSTSQTPYCSNDYYNIYFATCPFGQRTFFQRLNGDDWLFDPAYRSFYADPDLSIRAHVDGHDVIKVPRAWSMHHNVPNADGHAFNNAAYYGNDRQTFVTRWAHLGPPPIDPSDKK